jgi:hypothetical protein
MEIGKVHIFQENVVSLKISEYRDSLDQLVFHEAYWLTLSTS